MTEDHIIFQGQVKKDWEDARYHHEEEKSCDHRTKKCCDPRVIVLKLTCDPAIIKNDGRIRRIRPRLYEIGDVIRINVFEIVSVGPSRCCLGEHKDDDDSDDDYDESDEC